MSLAKSAYVGGVRTMRSAARSAGLLSALEKRPDNRMARWARSLFAIYDIDDMVSLDLPWWTLQSVAKVDAFLRRRRNARVFEYGSGASTVWLARRAAEVISVEHDPEWYGTVQEKLSAFPNARLELVPPDPPGTEDPRYQSIKPGWRGRCFRNYVHTIDEDQGRFDVIVIDGRARSACLEVASSRIKPDGLIIFDNSHRAAYRQAIEASPLESEVTSGLTACLPYPDETTLLRPLVH